MEMKDRLQEIMEYKTGGKQTPFAKMLGWTPQYLKKLLSGGNFGLQPVITLLAAFPEIDARWLLLGEGRMLSPGAYTGIRQEMYAHIQGVLELERFLPYMNPNELHEFEQSVVMPRYGRRMAGTSRRTRKGNEREIRHRKREI